MDFKIVPLQANEFAKLFTLTDAQLKKLGAVRMIADKFPGFPCRVSLEDAAIGEEVILLTYEYHKAVSPYRASGPLFVRKNAKAALPGINEIPKMLNHRLLSVRGYNKSGMMQLAIVTEGSDLKNEILKMFANEKVAYIHIHNARPGCFNCLVEKA